MNEEKSVQVLSDKTIIKRLLAYMKGHYLTVVIAFVLMVVAVLFDVSFPLIVEQILLELSNDSINFSRVLLFVVLYGALLLATYGMQYIQSLMLQKMGQEVMYKIREDVFVAIEHF